MQRHSQILVYVVEIEYYFVAYFDRITFDCIAAKCSSAELLLKERGSYSQSRCMNTS